MKKITLYLNTFYVVCGIFFLGACSSSTKTETDFEALIKDSLVQPYLEIAVGLTVDPFDDDSVLFNTLMRRGSNFSNHELLYLESTPLKYSELCTNDSLIQHLISKIYLDKQVFFIRLYAADESPTKKSSNDSLRFYDEIRHELLLNPIYKEDIVFQKGVLVGEDSSVIRLEDPNKEILRMRIGLIDSIEILDKKLLESNDNYSIYELTYNATFKPTKFAVALGIIPEDLKERKIKFKIRS